RSALSLRRPSTISPPIASTSGSSTAAAATATSPPATASAPAPTAFQGSLRLPRTIELLGNAISALARRPRARARPRRPGRRRRVRAEPRAQPPHLQGRLRRAVVLLALRLSDRRRRADRAARSAAEAEP